MTKTHEGWKRLLRFAEKHKAVLTVLGCVLLFLALANPTHAQSAGLSDLLDNPAATIFTWISELLGLIIQGLTWVVLMLVDILLQFISYNSFGTAPPVNAGWGLVRDVANMFFIVILLISAFATIIGYDTGNFHYTKVLPKLLLMAVLVNFSKTLIELLIDFSQVIMLTFVNAFRQAGPGNFVAALHLQQLTQAATQTLQPAGGGAAAAPPVGSGSLDLIFGVILAYLLAIAVLIISLVVIGIMIAYVLVRIITLWMLLIFSPLAFFATAVPARLAKGLNTFTGKYWSQLGNMLSGGPIMAFLLWLTMATVQNSATQPGGLSGNVLNFNTASSASGSAIHFASAVGNVGDLASFIVAIAMLIIAIDAAIEMGGAVGGLAGAAKGRLKRAATSAATTVAASPLYAGRAMLRGGRAVAGGVYGAVNRRVDLTGKLARATQAVTGRIPFVGAALAPALRRKETEQRVQAAKEAKEALAGTELLTPERQRQVYQQAIRQGESATATMGEKHARADALGKMTELDAKNQKKSMTATLEKKFTTAGMDNVSAKQTAASQAAVASDRIRLKGLEEQKQAFEALNMQVESEKVDEQIKQVKEKNPTAIENRDDFVVEMEKVRRDPSRIKSLSPEAKAQVGVMTELMGSAVKRDPKDRYKITGIDEKLLAEFKDKNKNDKVLVANADAVARKLRLLKTGTDWNGIKNFTLQQNPDGMARMVDENGKYAWTTEQKAALDAIDRNIMQAADKGRSSSGTLNAKAFDSVKMGLDSLALSSVMQDANRAGDQAGSKALKNIVIERTNEVAQAGTADDRIQKMERVTHVLTQLSYPNVDAQTQLSGLAGFHTGGGTQVMLTNFNDLAKHQRRELTETIKLTMKLSDEIGRKAATGAALSAEEQAVNQMATQLETQIRALGKQAPAGLRNALKSGGGKKGQP